MKISYDFYGGREEFIYTAERGETVQSIAERFGASPSKLITENVLSEEIRGGERLIISRAKGIRYEVMPSDTIDSVAKEFGTTVEKIAEENGLNYVYPKQILYVEAYLNEKSDKM